eukprot:6458631-Prymnesium_polylepis.1
MSALADPSSPRSRKPPRMRSPNGAKSIGLQLVDVTADEQPGGITSQPPNCGHAEIQSAFSSPGGTKNPT